MIFGQRALLVWFLHFLTLAFLVLKLDVNFEPLVFCALLWLTDLITVAFLVLRCIRHFSSIGPNSRSTEENSLVADMPKLSPAQMILATVPVLAKLAFEVLLFIRLKHRTINLLLLMVPLWICLALVILNLSIKVVKFHTIK